MENLGAELKTLTNKAIAERRREIREKTRIKKEEEQKLLRIPKTIRHLVPSILKELKGCAESRQHSLVVCPLTRADFKTRRAARDVPKDAPLTGTTGRLRKYFQNQGLTVCVRRIKPRVCPGACGLSSGTIFGFLILKW